MINPVRNHRVGKGVSRPTKGQKFKVFVRGFRIFGLSSAFLGLAWFGYSALGYMDKPVQEIQLSGEFDQVRSSEVEELLSAYAGLGLLSLDLDQVRTQIEQVPWIAEAQVSRQWPSTLVVNIDQHRLVARWGDDAYVSDQGLVVSGYQVEHSLPLLQSHLDEVRDLLTQYRLLSQALSQLGLSLDELHESRSGDLELVLDNGIQVKLGNKELLTRVQRFIAVWNLDLYQQAEQVNQIDVRYANGLAVNWNSDVLERVGVQQMGDTYGELARR